MKSVRLVTGLMFLALLLALAPAALAQDRNFGLSPEDMSALNAASANTASATSGQFTLALTATFAGGDESGSVDLNGTGTWDASDPENVQFSFSMTGTAGGTDPASMLPLDAEIRFVGNSLYVSSPMLAMVGVQGEWLQFSSTDMSSMGAALPMNPGALLGAGGADAGTPGMGGMGEMMAALGNLDPTQFVSMSRNGDQFTTNVDLATLFASPDFQAFLMSMAAQGGTDVTGPEAQQALGMLAAAAEGSVFTIDQYIADGALNRVVLAAALNIDPSAVGEPGEPGSVAFTFDLGLNGLNAAYPVVAPEGAVSFEEMMQEMMGGSSGG